MMRYEEKLIEAFGHELADKLIAFDTAWRKDLDKQRVCADCGVQVELFMLREELWTAIAPSPDENNHSLLCIHCTENRLGRRLQKSDITNASVNALLFWHFDSKLGDANARPVAGPVWVFGS